MRQYAFVLPQLQQLILIRESLVMAVELLFQ